MFVQLEKNSLHCLFQVFLEQKKMLKTALTIAKFKTYVPMIEEETKQYFERWGESGVRGIPAHLFQFHF